MYPGFRWHHKDDPATKVNTFITETTARAYGIKEVVHITWTPTDMKGFVKDRIWIPVAPEMTTVLKSLKKVIHEV